MSDRERAESFVEAAKLSTGQPESSRICSQVGVVTRKTRNHRNYPPDYVSAETLAYRLDVAPHLVEMLVRESLLPKPELVGALKRWDFAEVKAFIKARGADTAANGLEPNGRKRDAYLERLRRGTTA